METNLRKQRLAAAAGVAEVGSWFRPSFWVGRRLAANDSRAGPCWSKSKASDTFVTTPRRSLNRPEQTGKSSRVTK